MVCLYLFYFCTVSFPYSMWMPATFFCTATKMLIMFCVTILWCLPYVFVIKGNTDCAAWQMTSASPLHHQFPPSQRTACVSWWQPDRLASAVLKQRRIPLEHSPQRDTLLEAPSKGTVTVCSPLIQRNCNLEVNSFHPAYSVSEKWRQWRL